MQRYEFHSLWKTILILPESFFYFCTQSYRMPLNHFGEFAALITAVFWTITALAFEYSGKRVGSLTLNLLRLLFAVCALGIFNYFRRGLFFPEDAGLHQWLWLGLSALVGFVIGDYTLFRSFILIGARVAMLIMSLVPPFTALLAWIVLGEKMTPMNFLGMGLTLIGIAVVILTREVNEDDPSRSKKISLKYSLAGLLLALVGSMGQASGLIMSKYGMGNYDAFAASHIRVIVGAFSFVLIFTILRRWNGLYKSVSDGKAMIALTIGSIFGPFLGVSFSLLAIQYTNAAIASTIMSISPVLIILPSVLIFKEKLKWKEVIGAVIAVTGVIIFFV